MTPEQLFDRVRTQVGVALVACMIAGTAAADDAAAVFARHRDMILAPGVHRFDGYTFATVVAPIGVRGEVATRQRAQFMTTRMFFDQASGDPARCVQDGPLRKQYIEAARVVMEQSFDASGLETLFQESRDGNFILVKSIPEDRLAQREIPCEVITGKLCDLAALPSAPVALACMVLEFAPEPRAATAAAAFQRALEREYPALVRASRGEAWAAIPVGYPSSSTTTDRTTSESALRFANERPGDKAALTVASEALRRAGYTRAAALLPAPKQAMEPLPEGRLALLRREVDSIASKFKERPVPAEPQQADAWKAELGATVRWLEVLAAFGGRSEMCRGSGPADEDVTRSFQAGNPDLLRTVSMSLSRGVPTVESWNLVAASLRMSGAPALSVEACRIALAVEPNHPYAPLNELLAFQALGDRAQVEQGLKRLEAGGPLNDWSSRKAEELRLWLNPAPVPTKVEKPAAEIVPTPNPDAPPPSPPAPVAPPQGDGTVPPTPAALSHGFR